MKQMIKALLMAVAVMVFAACGENTAKKMMWKSKRKCRAMS